MVFSSSCYPSIILNGKVLSSGYINVSGKKTSQLATITDKQVKHERFFMNAKQPTLGFIEKLKRLTIKLGKENNV